MNPIEKEAIDLVFAAFAAVIEANVDAARADMDKAEADVRDLAGKAIDACTQVPEFMKNAMKPMLLDSLVPKLEEEAFAFARGLVAKIRAQA